MFHNAAMRLADYFSKKDWAISMNRELLIYAFERRMISLVFYCSIFVVAGTMKKLPETLSFLLPLSLIRSKIGGWHAPSLLGCVSLTLGTMLLAVYVIGPLLIRQQRTILFFAFAFDFLLLISRPCYPDTLNFDNRTEKANNIIKNRLVVYISFLQIISVLFFSKKFAIYSIPATGVAEVTLIIEKTKKEISNGTRKNDCSKNC